MVKSFALPAREQLKLLCAEKPGHGRFRLCEYHVGNPVALSDIIDAAASGEPAVIRNREDDKTGVLISVEHYDQMRKMLDPAQHTLSFPRPFVAERFSTSADIDVAGANQNILGFIDSAYGDWPPKTIRTAKDEAAVMITAELYDELREFFFRSAMAVRTYIQPALIPA